MRSHRNVAHCVRRLVRGFRGDARLYRMAPPLEGHEHVVVEAVSSDPFGETGAETVILGADESGGVNYMAFLGRLDGSLDHNEALRRVGYEVASTDAEGAA